MSRFSFIKKGAEEEHSQSAPVAVAVDEGQAVVDNVPLHKVQEDKVQEDMAQEDMAQEYMAQV